MRPAEPADQPFLLELFAATLPLDLSAFPAAVASRVLLQQYAAQQAALSARHPAVEDLVLIGSDGAPYGRLVLQELGDALHVVEVALRPASRGAGIGTAVLTLVQERAAAEGKAVVLKVAHDNPAERLYRRLGFDTVGVDEVRATLRWDPSTASHAAASRASGLGPQPKTTS